MRLKIATWNINSVRLREPLVLRLLREQAPDVLCLQETKSPVEKIPTESFLELGYRMIARGEKGYNGVATLSRLPMTDLGHGDFCPHGHARHIAGRLENGVEIHNFYVPAGGDEPDREANWKFAHKLDFVAAMARWGAERAGPALAMGDLNIAPREDDVWSHKQLLNVVSHTPAEVELFESARKAGGWADVTRDHIPDGKLYSWWSYRAKDWAASDRGRRLDHIWASPELRGASRAARVLKDCRGWEKPSDHAPVVAEFEL